MISLPPPPEKPQCVHHNDADNCLLCGTKKLKRAYNVNLDATGAVKASPVTFCWKHHMKTPCLACQAAAVAGRHEEVVRRAHVAAINAHSVKLWDEIRREEFNIRWPRGKCVHGHYLSESYCHVCSLALIDPDYDLEVYRREITKALSNAKRVLGGVARKIRNAMRDEKGLSIPVLAEGEKNFTEIEMIVDLEIWKATKKYGSEMNGALAYTIARNTAQKFLGDLITEQTIFVRLDLEFATPKDREDHEKLVSQYGDDFERLTNDPRANPEDRQTAQRLINEYGERIPRFASLDNTVQNENGEKGDLSAAEAEIHEKEEQAKYRAPDPADALETHRPALAALVATWRGDQRKVGEAMLAGGFNVRDVPGVSKSQTSRLYSVVVRAFKALIANAVTK